MGGVNLKHSADEKSYHPVIVNHMDVCVVAIDGISEKREEELAISCLRLVRASMLLAVCRMVQRL